MRTAAVVSDEKIAALQHGTYLTERRATDDNGLAAQEFRKLASFFPFVVRANDHRLHATLLPQSRQALRIIFQWPSAAGATAADTDGDHRTRGGYVRQQLRRELTVPVGEADLQLAVVHLPAQGFYDFKIAQHFVLHRTPRKADVKCRVESAIVPLLGRRRRLRIAHPFRGIHQRAQKCREPVIDIPPRRDGNVEAPASPQYSNRTDSRVRSRAGSHAACNGRKPMISSMFGLVTRSGRKASCTTTVQNDPGKARFSSRKRGVVRTKSPSPSSRMTSSERPSRRGDPTQVAGARWARQKIANLVGTRTDKNRGVSIDPFQTMTQTMMADEAGLDGSSGVAFAIRRVVLIPSTNGMSSTRPPQARTSRAPTTASSR